jgi:hypothetical protein
MTAVILMLSVSVAFAHPNVPLLGASGAAVSGTTPYSPKMTCSANACHQADPALAAKHNYGSGSKMSVHTQGVIASDDKVYWQSYDVKSFEHGASVGRHMNQGRNEDFSNSFRANYALPFFTSSPGMFGKF